MQDFAQKPHQFSAHLMTAHGNERKFNICLSTSGMWQMSHPDSLSHRLKLTQFKTTNNVSNGSKAGVESLECSEPPMGDILTKQVNNFILTQQ